MRRQSPIIIKALWGNELHRKWPEVIMEVANDSELRRRHWRRQKELAVAYGLNNYRFIWQYGYDVVLADESMESKPGQSIWLQKLRAMKLAFEMGHNEVLWLDWDTKVSIRPSLALDRLNLQNGPPFQGRLRFYRDPQLPRGHHDVFHGGCYYVRDVGIIDYAIDVLLPLHERAMDEAALTVAVDDLFFGGQKPEIQSYRDKGFDNPELYRTGKNPLRGVRRYRYNEGIVGPPPHHRRTWDDSQTIRVAMHGN